MVLMEQKCGFLLIVTQAAPEKRFVGRWNVGIIE
jgi:hypothetical protein